jgi:hypothetical protein
MNPNMFSRETVPKKAEVVNQEEEVENFLNPAHKVTLDFQNFLG